MSAPLPTASWLLLMLKPLVVPAQLLPMAPLARSNVSNTPVEGKAAGTGVAVGGWVGVAVGTATPFTVTTSSAAGARRMRRSST